MNRFDVDAFFHTFVIEHGHLKKRVGADLKEVGYFRRGVLYVMFQGKEYDAASLAWTLQTLAIPEYRVIPKDGDYRNLVADNLLALTGANHRYLQSGAQGAYTHPLETRTYTTPEACLAAWRDCLVKLYGTRSAQVYLKDRREADAYRIDPQVMARRAAADIRKTAKTVALLRQRRSRPTPPKAEPGYKWHFRTFQWLRTTAPVHPMDDYIVRCHAFEELGAFAMRWSEEHGRVAAVTPWSLQAVLEHKAHCEHEYCKRLPIIYEKLPEGQSPMPVTKPA